MKPRPSLFTVLAAAAVLLAVSGGSYAAALITGADVKDSSLTGKDHKDKSLSKRDFKGSIAGLKGDTGATGALGAQGAPGAQGPAGPFPDVLPSGKTLTGVYSVTGVATQAGQYFDSPISFGFRFAAAPTVVTVGFDDTAGEAAAAGCPGTANEPKAAPGKVCLYEMGHDNVAAYPVFVEADGEPARVAGYKPPFGAYGTATQSGTIAEVYSASAGNLFNNGTWAATSP